MKRTTKQGLPNVFTSVSAGKRLLALTLASALAVNAPFMVMADTIDGYVDKGGRI